MNENEKDFIKRLNNLDDSFVEEIAENYPALSENAKMRILKQSLRKSGLSDDDIEIYEEPEEEEPEIIEEPEGDEISVSGTEQYEGRISWHKYASSVAALIVAVVGITGVVLLRRNMNTDDFDISSPPFVDDIEQNQVTEIVSGSYIDNGYRAGGYDYANINGYEGSVQYGMTTATEPHEIITETIFTTAAPVITPEAYNDTNEEAPPADNNETHNAETPATNPPATTAPPVVVTTTAVPVATETTEAVTEQQKTFIDGMRYAEIAGTGERMGFGFRPDGTLTMYYLDEYGNIIAGTENIFSYEFTENSFSFGISPEDPSWKTGTLVNPNDTGNFIVMFADGTYNFSIEPPVFAEPEVSIEGVWHTSGMDMERTFTFREYTMNGSYVTADNIEITFTYERAGNEITFYFDTGETARASVSGNSVISVFDFVWSDGRTEHFYSSAP